MRVLVLEDNEDNMRLFRLLLQKRGHEVAEARSLAEARALLAASVPDIVLSDIQLAGEAADGLAAEIRERYAAAELPVVAVTAQAMLGDRERLLALGFDGYIGKPIDTRSFVREVEAFIRARPGPPGPPAAP